MKIKLLISFIILSLSINSFSQEKTVIEWDNKIHDFGKIDSNKSRFVSKTFSFIIKGDIPFVIHKVDVSCGCVKAEWPKHPIKANEKASIKVIYDSKGQKGYFDKRVYLKTNLEKDIQVLRIKGVVK